MGKKAKLRRFLCLCLCGCIVGLVFCFCSSALRFWFFFLVVGTAYDMRLGLHLLLSLACSADAFTDAHLRWKGGDATDGQAHASRGIRVDSAGALHPMQGTPTPLSTRARADASSRSKEAAMNIGPLDDRLVILHEKSAGRAKADGCPCPTSKPACSCPRSPDSEAKDPTRSIASNSSQIFKCA